MTRRDTARALDVVVIGGGHCGLAMSHELTRRSVDHAAIERTEVANAWRTERWASQRLLTTECAACRARPTRPRVKLARAGLATSPAS